MPWRAARARSSKRQIATGSRQTISEATDHARIEKWWWPSANESPSGIPNTTAQSRCLRNVISVSRVLASPFGVVTNPRERRSATAASEAA